MPEKTMTVSCGCKMHYLEDDTGYNTRYEWCVEHEAMASQLRRIMNDCELVLADLARHDGRVEIEP